VAEWQIQTKIANEGDWVYLHSSICAIIAVVKI